MLCPSCGHENRQGAAFCENCGIRLDSPSEATNQQDLTTSADFVGRQRELGELVAALDEAMSGRGRLVMLVGEPGIGKTRMEAEPQRPSLGLVLLPGENVDRAVHL